MVHDPRGERRFGHVKPDNRDEYQRDRDRIIYSSAYRRLAGVTQVVSAHEGHVFHNRLTHTIKVAQIARRVAEMVLRDTEEDVANGAPAVPLNADATEAAAHAHDIGHPPFGHVAEVELQRILEEECKNDTFEGNAQSFRIVTKVASAHPDSVGLNLTRATLSGILKYPYMQTPDTGPALRKWGAYRTEFEDFEFATNGRSGRTLEAEVMDWADDITYAVHDVEDMFRAGLVPADRLRQSSAREEFAEWVFGRWSAKGRHEASDEINNALLVFPTFFGIGEHYTGTKTHRTALRLFTSNLIRRYVQATKLELIAGEWRLQVEPEGRLEVDVLKELTWRFVIERPALASQQHGQKSVIRQLFEIFHDAADSTKKHVDQALLPPRIVEDLAHLQQIGVSDPNLRSRLICDAICSMTEDEALRMHSRLTGLSLGSVLDSVV